MNPKLIDVPRTREAFGATHDIRSCPISAARLLEAPWPNGMNTKPLTDGSWKHHWKHHQPVRLHEGPHTTSRRPGILVVDDDVAVRTLLNAALWHYGFAVWLAGDGTQALELYQELRADIDLVLLDVQMPGRDGPQTLAALRRINPEFLCCFMTADSKAYTQEELLEQGAVRVLQKPFHLAAVAQLLWQLVNASRTTTARTEAHSTTEGTASEMFLG